MISSQYLLIAALLLNAASSLAAPVKLARSPAVEVHVPRVEVESPDAVYVRIVDKQTYPRGKRSHTFRRSRLAPEPFARDVEIRDAPALAPPLQLKELPQVVPAPQRRYPRRIYYDYYERSAKPAEVELVEKRCPFHPAICGQPAAKSTSEVPESTIETTTTVVSTAERVATFTTTATATTTVILSPTDDPVKVLGPGVTTGLPDPTPGGPQGNGGLPTTTTTPPVPGNLQATPKTTSTSSSSPDITPGVNADLRVRDDTNTDTNTDAGPTPTTPSTTSPATATPTCTYLADINATMPDGSTTTLSVTLTAIVPSITTTLDGSKTVLAVPTETPLVAVTTTLSDGETTTITIPLPTPTVIGIATTTLADGETLTLDVPEPTPTTTSTTSAPDGQKTGTPDGTPCPLEGDGGKEGFGGVKPAKTPTGTQQPAPTPTTGAKTSEPPADDTRRQFRPRGAGHMGVGGFLRRRFLDNVSRDPDNNNNPRSGSVLDTRVLHGRSPPLGFQFGRDIS